MDNPEVVDHQGAWHSQAREPFRPTPSSLLSPLSTQWSLDPPFPPQCLTHVLVKLIHLGNKPKKNPAIQTSSPVCVAFPRAPAAAQPGCALVKLPPFRSSRDSWASPWGRERGREDQDSQAQPGIAGYKNSTASTTTGSPSTCYCLLSPVHSLLLLHEKKTSTRP